MTRPSHTGGIVRVAVIAVLLLATLLSCNRPAYIGTPDGFARFDETDFSAAISPEGVVIRARLVENDPRQELEFWSQALKRQMETSGYLLIEESDFTSELGPGVLFEWAAPVDGEDWIYLTAIAATNKKIAVVESAGSAEHYLRYRAAIRDSLNTLQIGSRVGE